MLYKSVEKIEQDNRRLNIFPARSIIKLGDLLGIKFGKKLYVSKKLLHQADIEAYIEALERMGGRTPTLWANPDLESKRVCEEPLCHSGATQSFATLKEQPLQIIHQAWIMEEGLWQEGK